MTELWQEFRICSFDCFKSFIIHLPLVFASLFNHLPLHLHGIAVFALFPVVSWCIQVPRPLLLFA